MFAGVVIFFALTRTEVGRDGLRHRIEKTFADEFAGRLEIGRLTGNLVQTLYARDVRLLDPEGRLVVHIDSLVARPAWPDLLSKRLSISALTIFRPTVSLFYDADSTWNLARIFEPDGPSAPRRQGDAGAPWDFDSADLRIVDGRLRTGYAASPPPLAAEGWLFDLADAEIRDLSLRATVEWGREAKLIDLLDFTASIPGIDFKVEALQGQLLIEPERVLFNQLVFQAGATDLRLGGVLRNRAALADGRLGAVEIEADLRPSRLDFDALRRLVPRLPLADVVALEGRLAGPLARLDVENLALQRGQTRLTATGLVRGLPDSLGFDLAFANSRVDAADLRAVLPTVAWPALDHLGPIAFTLQAEGGAQRSTAGALRLRTDAQLDLRGAPGHLAGTARIALRPGREPVYVFDLTTDSLDLALVTQDPSMASTLSGRLRGQGRGLTFDSLDATLLADLYDVHFAGRHADTLHLDASVARRRLEATGFVRERGAGIFGTAVYDARASLPRYQLGLFTRYLDLGPLLGLDSLRSALNTRIALDGQGTGWQTARGTLTVTFDSSSIMGWKQRVRAVRPQQLTLAVAAPGAEAPRVTLSGEALDVRIDGDVGAALSPVLRLWTQALADALGDELDKPFPRGAGETRLARLVAPLPPPPRLRLEARNALATAALDTLGLDVTVEVKQAELLASLLPMIAPPATDLAGAFHARATADALHLEAHVAADSLGTPDAQANALRATLKAEASLETSLAASLDATLDITADTLAAGGQRFTTPKLALQFNDRKGRLHLTTGPENGPLELAARLSLLPDRNRVVVDTARLALGDYVWATARPAQIDLFRDATELPELAFVSRSADGTGQHIALRGVFSQEPQDSLFVELGGIALAEVSETLSIAPALGGRLGGRLTFTHAEQPEITGALTVGAFSLDGYVLGDLVATSRYVPGLPDVLLDVFVQPLPPEVPAPPLDASSDLRVRGTFRLPGGGDPGTLDLALDARYADVFFFERYVFKDLLANVRGGFSGEGTIQGTFRKPLFDAAMTLNDGYFEVPEFNLRYNIEGPARVDREGIMLDGVTLRDPTGGSARLDGTIFFNDYRFFSFDLRGTLDALQIIDVPNSRELPFYGQIWASGNATLTGPIYQALLRSDDAVTSAQSDIYIPILEEAAGVDPGFIVFTDSTGQIPEVQRPERRKNILATRPAGERDLLGGLEMDLNIFAPQGSTVHLVIDPLLGDEINAVGSGRIQLQRREGDFFTYGSLEAVDGDYLFTAGEVFVRRFLIEEGTITWDGDPLNARLDIQAAYRTRASRAGLPDDIANRLQSSLPLVVHLDITGRVATPAVALDLALDRSSRETISNAPFLEAYLNQPDRAAQHATSVLLTNSFLLSTESTVLTGSAFNSVSQLVSSQLNRYLSQVLPNADFSFGVQGDETAEELDLTAGLAIRLLNERLVIRGQGVYRGLGSATDATVGQGLLGEFVVEIRLNPSVSVEVFYRREGDILSENLLTNETGAGVSYQTQFPTWRRLLYRIFGTPPPEPTAAADTTRTPAPSGSR